ncbi:MAG: TonB-dependent receptor plug domain-containing protein [Bacteroidales bacterium]|nr:TonB-dependent receptor plug domain-containing protein [Bacteroidales bacterium]
MSSRTLRYTLLYIAFLLAYPLHGQSSFSNDTINIGEVVISSKKANSDAPGFKTSSIDTTILKLNSHNSVAYLLSHFSGVSVKSYGMGGSTSPSFRGTGAGHTLLTWNEININHPMLGQSDLSLIPAGLIDDIQIYYGGASMPLNSGGIGGTINLETRPVWKKETLISVNPGIASFGQYTGLIKLRTGNSAFQSVTKGFFQSSENDFRYLNTGISNEPVWQKRTNSQFNQRGFVQEFYLRQNKSVTSARLWYESTNRNLPSSMLIQQPKLRETQSDESLRTMLNWDHFGGSNKFSVTGAWMMTKLNYTNSLASIDSRNNSGTFILKGTMERKVDAFTNLKIALNEEVCRINSNNYNDNTTRNTVSLTATAERNSGGRFTSLLLVREILDTRNFLIPDFSAGLQYRLLAGKEYYLKANLSRNSKIPSMNDMFWIPGGNPDLKNEYAFIYEITYEMNHKLSAPITMNYDLSLYRNNIKDMIQWYQGEYSYWTAGNIKGVNTAGIESSFSLDYSENSFAARLRAAYVYTRATTAKSNITGDASIGRQLIYIQLIRQTALFF